MRCDLTVCPVYFIATFLCNICFHVNMKELAKDECSFGMSQNKCKKQWKDLKTGQFYENFLKYPSQENFEAICNFYRSWHQCNRTLSLKCNNSAWEDFSQSQSFILTSCTINKEVSEIKKLINCLKTQSVDNHLFHGCYVMMTLKLDSCQSRKELLWCEDELVRSACGYTIANFRLNVAIETWLGTIEKPTTSNQLITITSNSTSNERCLYEPQPQGTPSEESFRYSINCSPEFPEAMRLCYKEFFNSRVAFHQSMLAVVKSSVDLLLGWCSALGKYEMCLEPIEESCPEGIEYLYRLSFEWKKYYDIAIYICQRKEKYIEYLPCFNKAVHESSRPSLCRELLRKDYSDQHMYQLKCNSKNTGYINTTFQEIDGLIKCFETFAIKSCTSEGRDIIYPLIRLQYSFDYLPTCIKPRNKTMYFAKTTKRVRYSFYINSSIGFKTTPPINLNSSVLPTPLCNCNCVCPEIVTAKSKELTSDFLLIMANGCFHINLFTITLSLCISISFNII